MTPELVIAFASKAFQRTKYPTLEDVAYAVREAAAFVDADWKQRRAVQDVRDMSVVTLDETARHLGTPRLAKIGIGNKTVMVAVFAPNEQNDETDAPDSAA